MNAEEMAMALGAAKRAVDSHDEVLATIFEKLDGIKTAVDQNMVRAENRDAKLVELKADVAEVDRKIENGLRREVRETKAELFALKEAIDRRKKEAALEEQRGVYGFFHRGLAQFRDRGSYIVVTSMIIGGAFTLLWLAAKVFIFRDGVFCKLFKTLGISI